ncbi:hypothetical protein Tco_0968402 [Tanacetum coccineum]
MPELLYNTLKNILPQIIKESIKKTIPKFDKRVKKTLKAQVPEIVLKPLYKEFNALNKMESTRFVTLQKHLCKAIRKTVGKSIQSKMESTSSRSFEYSPTPPLKVVDKGKDIASKDDQVKQIMPLMDEGGSTLSFSNLNTIRAAGEGRMTLEDAKAQMEEMNRLAKLKAKKGKSEKRLNVLTDEELKAHATKLAVYEAKRAKMLKEYNHCIRFRDDHLPITKISYRVKNSTKEATMRITRNN